MRRTLPLILAAIAIAAHAGSLWALDLTPGVRIRWVISGGPSAPTVGHTVTMLTDTLIARAEHAAADTALPLRSLASLERYRGRHNQSARCALVGGCAGALAGPAVVWILGQVVDEASRQLFGVHPTNKPKLSDYAAAMLVGAGAGAVGGAAVGCFRRGPELWETLPLAGSRFGAILGTGPELRVGLAARF